MFLLIEMQTLAADGHPGFNTSHVSINPRHPHMNGRAYVRFNTSHVSINLVMFIGLISQPWVSIHLMFLLIML